VAKNSLGFDRARNYGFADTILRTRAILSGFLVNQLNVKTKRL